MTRHCRICEKDMGSPDDAEKEYLYHKSFCSLKCRREYRRKRRERYKRKNRCPECGKEIKREGVYCQKCIDRRGERNKEREKRYKKENKCPKCGKEVKKKKIYCQECLDKRKKRRERYKREKVCPKCGRDLSNVFKWDNVFCPECLEKCRNYDFYGIFATDAEIRTGVKG